MSNNPLLQPVHGISLQDYAAASSQMANGVDTDHICKALGIELPLWEEASAIWVSRMQEDQTFEVVTLFGQYFGDANSHPKLGNMAAAAISADGHANLQKMSADQYFFEELNGARQAAYEYGLDGAQWIQDNFGIPLGEFQNVAMHWMEKRNAEEPGYDAMRHFLDYREAKQAEYAGKFAAEQGGNVADDINF